MIQNKTILKILLLSLLYIPSALNAQHDVLRVKKTTDFTVNGKGTAKNWEQAEWNVITPRDSKTLQQNNWSIPPNKMNSLTEQYKTSFKVLYTDKGVYCLYKCEDSTITATLKGDYLNLYDEDVVEAFFWPDTTLPIYFEYELSPLNYELPILIVNNKGKAMGWKPWQYEGDKKTIHAISKTDVSSTNKHFTWYAEFFVPYSLLGTLGNIPPQKGTQWRANFYRIDYDHTPVYSSWQLTRNSYHDPERFGILQFD